METIGENAQMIFFFQFYYFLHTKVHTEAEFKKYHIL